VAQPYESHANRTASVLEWYVGTEHTVVQHLIQMKKKKNICW